MQTIQAVERYFPQKCGGIQVHINELVWEFKRQGIESKIAASSNHSHPESYEYKGLEVYRYPVFPNPRSEPNHGQFPHGGFAHFANWLKRQKAEIYHQHQWTPQCGLPHLRLARELGMTTAVTIHLPQPICQRQTLMLHGREACNGRIEIARCSRCCDRLSQRLPKPFLKAASQIPSSVLSRVPLPASCFLPESVEGTLGSWIRPLTTPAYISARWQSLQEMAKLSDRIIVVCQWLFDALTINGLPEEKLVLCRYGIDNFGSRNSRPDRPKSPNRLKVLFLGRWHRTKGIHILIEAIKTLPPEVDIQLFIHGIANDAAYQRDAIAQIDGDRRIQVCEPFTRDELPESMANFDVLAVPSQWLETGPLVVLEAYASGLPVVGSNLGGIAELVRDSEDGFLVPPTDADAWAKAFLRLATEPELLSRLREGIQPVRTIAREATETVTLYENLLSNSRTSRGKV